MVNAIVHFKPLCRLIIVLVELLGNIGADVPETLLDLLGSLQALLWRDTRLSLSQQLLNEVCDVTPGNGNVLDTAANDVAFGLGETKTKR